MQRMRYGLTSLCVGMVMVMLVRNPQLWQNCFIQTGSINSSTNNTTNPREGLASARFIGTLGERDTSGERVRLAMQR